jgi:nucleoid-associated protein YgaU
MAIEDKKKGKTTADRKAQIDAANKRTAAKIARKRAAAAAKKRTTAAGKRGGGTYVPGVGTAKPKAKKGGAAYIPGTGVVGGVAKGKFIAEHTVKSGDTLSAIAKKYYGSGSKPYYELIQKANPELIKDVNLIYPDQVFKIPALPPELKK